VFLFHKEEKKTHIHDKRDFASRLKCLLGFKPKNLRLYETAFIHKSASYRLPDRTKVNNERLEFLGDAILDAILSEYLFHNFPDENEGFLTKMRARIVNREQLNQLAMDMGFEELVLSHLTSPNPTRNLYGDALEALIGALFIDIGYKKTRQIIVTRVLEKYLDLTAIFESETDYKSMILEWCQKKKLPNQFECTEETDPVSRKPLFIVSFLINNIIAGTGQGGTKKEAEQEASMRAWNKMKLPENDAC